MNKKNFEEFILNKLNNKFNEENYPKIKFYIFEDLLHLINFEIKDELEIYGVFENGELYNYIIRKWLRKNFFNGDKPLKGDRIKMILMKDDPNPIEPGTTGTVIEIRSMRIFDEDHLITKWDDGRSLNVILGYDIVEVIEEDNHSNI